MKEEMTREKELRIQMLGGFAMYYGEKAVVLKRQENSKSIRLFQMLLLSFPHGIAKNELMDNLYGWNEMSNRNRNLNNLIYRLKGQLISGGLPEDEYVEIREGKCFFKSKIPIVLDIWQFEEKIKKARGGGESMNSTMRPIKCIRENFCREIYLRPGFFKKATIIRNYI